MRGMPEFSIVHGLKEKKQGFCLLIVLEIGPGELGNAFSS